MKFKKIVLLIACLLFLAKTTSAYGQENVSPQYVSGQIIVRYKKDATPAKIGEQALARELKARSLLGKVQNLVEDQKLKISGQETPEEKLESIEEKKAESGVIKAKNVLEVQDAPESSEFVLYETDGRKSVEEMIRIFKSLPEVAHVEPNLVFHATEVVPNDTYYPEMWNLKKIEMEKAWDLTEGSNNVIVAVVDTGVDYGHEDFASRMFVDGYDFVTCEWISSFSGRCIDGYTRERDADPMDDAGHGTHVAGTIGAVTNNSLGVSGINWNVKIMPIKVLNHGGDGMETDIVDGIKYATDRGADIINLSLAGNYSCDSDSVYQEAINYALNAGVTVIAAAGNDNKDAAEYIPANCNGVIAVAASGPDDERASYSNYGELVDLAAPGGNNCDGTAPKCIRSTGFNKNDPSVLHHYYSFKQGTSMACPHVAGVAALMKAVNHNLRPDEIEALLKNNTDPFVNPPDQPIGTGRLNAFKALSAIGGVEFCPAGDEGNLDCDINGRINEPDLNLLLDYWAPNVPIPQIPPEYHNPDLNNDQKVDQDDLLILLNNWIP